MRSRAFLGLGSNLGDRKFELDRAVAGLVATVGIDVLAVATYLETAPMGYREQGPFLNTVVEIDTGLSPRELWAVAENLERKAARVRIVRYGPRTLDVDILLYGDLVLDSPELIIPHPRLRERVFVLSPLVEIAPAILLPPDNCPAHALLSDLLQKEALDAPNYR
ncbi:MAG: 2-amino-4-hydroxy-6-hydroxymethyldihydropteridine diphosphokinase [Peptococcaceae bacterium]|nr:2-amino-4-hydroxy-6-hydroxymethyldihydropteridine diphosphokinase [Peptococcaceae bacterium]